MKRRTCFQSQKGEGLVKTILIVAVLAAAGYFGYQYLWPMISESGGTNPATASTEATPTPGGSLATSPAGQAAQGAQAAGEVLGSGR